MPLSPRQHTPTPLIESRLRDTVSRMTSQARPDLLMLRAPCNYMCYEYICTWMHLYILMRGNVIWIFSDNNFLLLMDNSSHTFKLLYLLNKKSIVCRGEKKAVSNQKIYNFISVAYLLLLLLTRQKQFWQFIFTTFIYCGYSMSCWLLFH